MTLPFDHKAGLAAAARDGLKTAVRLYKAKNPEALPLMVRADVAAIKPRPKLMRKARVRAARLMINDPSYLMMNNADFAKHLSSDEPGYNAPPNLLTENFKPGERVEVAAMLAERGIALDPAHLTTPSKLKRALRSHHAGVTSTERASVVVVFTEEAVIIGDRSFPISKGPHRRIQTAHGKLNVAALRELLLDQPG